MDLSDSDKVVVETVGLTVVYGRKYAIKDINLKFERSRITAIIGPSGCGKSTLLRCINRMNDLIPDAKVQGKVYYRGLDIYSKDVDPVAVRTAIGMVFQRPNPFPMSIFDNVAFGLRVNGVKLTKQQMYEKVKDALEKAALWDEVKDRLDAQAFSLSGGQQQRLCIARALAVDPDVILLDEPTVSLDPISTAKIEQLLRNISQDYTIIIVTHNMQQAARVSDYTAVMMPDENMIGRLIEFGPTKEIFTNPRDKRTEDYISGRIG
ncbi:phosphate ABC transporter ATP-binding protein [Candidatus Caldarchaeum subterraneum]|uniref:Phosphate ABC transporter ATP-binding protein n=1 Tax=Caldiarchaeum subterraneum TaxID=311458 RepID=E6N8A0_CALS0|nr:phosphate ABC transporter ATP-binding protein [Candidatus Caldarchaeum subterraneum]BAJ51273.1 phosphate ABC transporter ATP-binding protein [Candidatus Caldarchaeum subterraneum]